MEVKMKRIINLLLVLSLICMPITGCAGFYYTHTEMPNIELPKAPIKPEIKTEVIKLKENNIDKVYVGYNIGDSLKLYEYLVKKDAYEEMLVYRINEMNKLIKEFGKAEKR
jgi:hypothetical protein